VGPALAERPRLDHGAPLAVLLAEHEPEVAELARRYLTRAGLRVTVAASTADTMAALTQHAAGVVVLDLTMPGLDARRLRRLLAGPPAPDVPPASGPGAPCETLPASGLGAPRGTLLAGGPTPAVYLLGGSMRPRDVRVSAEYCLRRPFSPRMLLSRVLSVAPATPPARTGTARTGTARASAPDPLPAPRRPQTIGSLTLDPATRRARTADREIPLTPAEFALLSALAADAGRVLTRDRLQAAMARPGSGRAVDVHIAQLRAKLAASAAIRTVRGVGYMFVPEGG